MNTASLLPPNMKSGLPGRSGCLRQPVILASRRILRKAPSVVAFPVDWILVAVRDARPGRRPASAVHINQRGENISPLTDVERSIHRDISKLLHLFWHWPCDLNLKNLSCVSDTDVLTQWIASEA